MNKKTINNKYLQSRFVIYRSLSNVWGRYSAGVPVATLLLRSIDCKAK